MHCPPDPSLTPLARLREVVRLLRGPGGCPWDIEQTAQTLVPNLLEEAYEAAEAIRGGNGDEMREELGDVLLQVVMQSEIASETGTFDFDSVADEITEKLIRRHPHVFGEVEAEDTAAVLANWEAIKRREKGDRPERVLERVPNGLPALMRAAKIQKKVERVGFDWPDAKAVLPKIREELDEVEEVLAGGDPAAAAEALAEELGDLLFAVTNLARKLDLDPETLLASANEKFIRRFTAVEDALEAGGSSAELASLEEMERAWQAVKAGG